MKKNRIIYKSSTITFSILMIFGAVNSFGSEMTEAFAHLGFPSYFRIELAFAKLVGAFLLLIPAVSKNFKEWAYAGFTITLLSAFLAHLSVGDSIGKIITPLIFFAILMVSYSYKDRL